MKLFLASELKHPTTMQHFETYVNGFENKKIAYIPTAANAEEGFESWKLGGTWQLLQTLEATVTVVQLEDYRSPDVIEQLKNKDIIWVGGGFCGYLMYWMRLTMLDQSLPHILQDENIIYAGSSAGSMITAKNLDIAEWYLGDGERGASVIPGLGWVDFDIFPHYEDSMLDEIKKLNKSEKLYLLKNGEHIVAQENNIQVYGEERIISK